MHKQALLYALAAMGNLGFSGLRIGRDAGKTKNATTRRTGRSPTRAAPYGVQAAEIRKWNDAVDAAKHSKARKVGGPATSFKEPRRTVEPARKVGGATVIGNLISNYQVHSNNVMTEFTGQRAKEYMRRVGGRSIDGVKAEAEHLHRARNKHQKKVSRMIGGRTLRVILQLSTNQQQRAETKRNQDWQMWEPVENGIWQYHVHDEVFPYYMFNDEAGDLFEFDPAKLHNSNFDDCNQAMHLYVETLTARHGQGASFGRAGTMEGKERIEEADRAFTLFCELHGHTLQETSAEDVKKSMTETPRIEDAGDETYALEG